MTADAEQLRQDGHRVEKWAVGWMLLSLALWAWFGHRFLLDDDRGLYAPAEGGRALVGILALAVIPTIITAATLVYTRSHFAWLRAVP